MPNRARSSAQQVVRRLTSIAVLLLLPAAACRTLSGPESDLDSARRRWSRNTPAAYEITVRQNCFCVPDAVGPVVVTVRGGAVQRRVYAPGTPLAGRAVDERYANVFTTVDGLFDLLAGAVQRNAASITASYDAERGYPTKFYIDYDARTADEERGYDVTGFRVLQ